MLRMYWIVLILLVSANRYFVILLRFYFIWFIISNCSYNKDIYVFSYLNEILELYTVCFPFSIVVSFLVQTFFQDNRIHIGTKIDMRVVILGLDGAGKTSILSAMRGVTLSISPPPLPTIGFNVESLEYQNLVFTLWDVSGQQKFRPLWKHYYHNTQAVIFIVDSSDRSRFDEAQNELSKILYERELKDALILIYANKQVNTGYV